ncbi:MAG: hypothetical protein ABI474_08490 [Actinomycetota bacterium]
MTFTTSRESYDRYMGRYSDVLASAFLSFVAVRPGMLALDVGCGCVLHVGLRQRQQRLRTSCFRRLGAPQGPFTLAARAFAVRGRRAA